MSSFDCHFHLTRKGRGLSESRFRIQLFKDNFAVPQKLIIGEYKPWLHIAPQGSSGILKAAKEEIYKDGLGFTSNQEMFLNDIAKSWS